MMKTMSRTSPWAELCFKIITNFFIYNTTFLQTSMSMDLPAVPPHWEVTLQQLHFRARDLTARQALKAFDDVYYRVLPEYRVPLNSTIEIYAFQTDLDYDAFNHIAVWEKRENGERSRADAEDWELVESVENVFNADGQYIYAAYHIYNEEINVLSLSAQNYYPLPPHWYYNDATRSVVWSGFGLTLPDAADAFDEAFSITRAGHIAHAVAENHQIVLRVYEINGQDENDAIACIKRPVGDLEWEVTYESPQYDPDQTYAYIEDSVIDDEGNNIGRWEGFPDTAFGFELDEEVEWVAQTPVPMEEFVTQFLPDDDDEDEESDINVMDIARSGAILQLLLF